MLELQGFAPDEKIFANDTIAPGYADRLQTPEENHNGRKVIAVIAALLATTISLAVLVDKDGDPQTNTSIPSVPASSLPTDSQEILRNLPSESPEPVGATLPPQEIGG